MTKKVFCLLAALLIVFNLAGCRKNSLPQTDSAEYSEIGVGAESLYLDIFFEDHEKHYLISTDQKEIGPALSELGLVEGKDGEYGLYIEAVEGERHVYDDGGKYWAFYENGRLAAQSVDQTEIRTDTVYALKVE